MSRDDFAAYVIEEDVEVLLTQALFLGEEICRYENADLDAILFELYGNFILFTTYYSPDITEVEVTMPSSDILYFLLSGLSLSSDETGQNYDGISI